MSEGEGEGAVEGLSLTPALMWVQYARKHEQESGDGPIYARGNGIFDNLLEGSPWARLEF